MLEHFHPSTQWILLPYYPRELEAYHNCANAEGWLRSVAKGLLTTNRGSSYLVPRSGYLHYIEEWKFGHPVLEKTHQGLISNPDTIKTLTTGEKCSFILTKDGCLYAAGENDSGQLGLGEDTRYRQVWTLVPTPEPVVTIAAGFRHSFILTESGHLYGTGLNFEGQLGLGDRMNRCRWTLVPTSETIMSIIPSWKHSLFITASGCLYATGLSYGEDYRPQHKWTLASTPETVITARVGGYHSFLITKSGRLYAIGSNTHGQLGLEGSWERPKWTLVPTPENVITVSTDICHLFIVTESGHLYIFDNDFRSRPSPGEKRGWMRVSIPESIISVDFNRKYIFILTRSGYLYSSDRYPLQQSGLRQWLYDQPSWNLAPVVTGEHYDDNVRKLCI